MRTNNAIYTDLNAEEIKSIRIKINCIYFVITHLHDVGDKYSDKSIQYLDDEFIYLLKEWESDLRAMALYQIGCYLGECIINLYGGKWVRNEANQYWIEIQNTDIKINPIDKPYKRYENGKADSLVGFMKAAGFLIKKS